MVKKCVWWRNFRKVWLSFLRNRFLVFWCIIKTIPLVSDRREESAPVQQVLNEGTIKEASCCFSHTWCAFNWLINGSLCVVISNIPPPFKTFALFNMNSALTCFSFILHPSFIMAYIWSSVLPSSIETSFDFFFNQNLYFFRVLFGFSWFWILWSNETHFTGSIWQ